MKTLKKIAVLLALASLAYLQACQREGCGRTVKSKDRISEESKAKMAYTGTETLVFLEIDNSDSTVLVFKPSEHYDTMQTSYSYYEAPNGDECIGYETSTEILYREYYCEERSWQFVCGIAATKEQLVLRFEELPRKKEDKYNFEIFFIADGIGDSTVDSIWGSVYVGKIKMQNGINEMVTKIGLDGTGSIFYDLKNGLIEWGFGDEKYEIKLLELIKN